MNNNEEVFFSYEDAIKNFDPYKNDPRSINYQRIHKVPKINWIRFFLNITLPIVILIISYIFLVNFFEFGNKKSIVIWFFILLYVFYLCIRMKSIVIWLVKAYQHFAPFKIRDKCRFEPSCSEYMILSIDKYGILKGLMKGFNRVYRCSHKDGGYDYP